MYKQALDRAMIRTLRQVPTAIGLAVPFAVSGSVVQVLQ
jgi:hypothetical protein